MTEPAVESPEARLRRLGMRSMRRGIKEMDIILSRYAAARLGDMSDAMLDLYDGLLAQNDQDLYQWVTAQVPPPARFDALVADIRAIACHP